MIIDCDAPSIPQSSPAVATSFPVPEDSGSMVKGKEVRKVRSLFPEIHLYLICNPFLFLSQRQDRRPEVRMLEYADIPGITKDRRLRQFQKLATSSKRIKTHHVVHDRPCPLLPSKYPTTKVAHSKLTSF
jgi:hypothetical protein